MFNAPDVIIAIPDIQTIYNINDVQEQELDETLDVMDDNIFLDTMNESIIERWEKILGISPRDDDSLEDRRFRVRTFVMERLAYSYRVIVRKLNSLCPYGYRLEISEDRTELTVSVVIKSKKMIPEIQAMLEDILPLNMIFHVVLLYNSHELIKNYTHEYLSQLTHNEIRESDFYSNK